MERALGFLEGVESRVAGALPPAGEDDELEPGAVD
jgi:hypothetical protein